MPRMIQAPRVKYLGFDFGSSNTSVVAQVTRPGVKGNEYVVFYDPHSGDRSFATAMGREGERTVYFSNACTRITMGEAISVEDLKESFSGTDTANGRLFLNEVARAMRESLDPETQLKYDFSALERIGFGVPAYFDEEEQCRYRANMSEALSEIFGIKKEKIVGRAEPELAAVAYNVSKRAGALNVRPAQNDGLLVLDFGGYTLDVAVMEFTGRAGSLSLNSYNCGSFQGGLHLPMGKGITAKICGEIYDEERFDYDVDKAKCALFCGDGYAAHAVNTRLRDNTELQVRYRYGDGDVVGGETVCVGLTPGGERNGCRTLNLENDFDNLVGNVFLFLDLGMRDRRRVNLKYVLFTGGGSAMKPLRDKVVAKMRERYGNEPVALWMDAPDTAAGELMLKTTAQKKEHRTARISSANAVALGACLIATDGSEYLTVVQDGLHGSGAGGGTAMMTYIEEYKRLLAKAIRLMKENGMRGDATDLGREMDSITNLIRRSWYS